MILQLGKKDYQKIYVVRKIKSKPQLNLVQNSNITKKVKLIQYAIPPHHALKLYLPRHHLTSQWNGKTQVYKASCPYRVPKITKSIHIRQSLQSQKVHYTVSIKIAYICCRNIKESTQTQSLIWIHVITLLKPLKSLGGF